MRHILVYTDGSSKGNPGPGGWGAIVADEHVQELGGGEASTTNNRMELRAALEALRYVRAKLGGAPIRLRTDSAYVVNGVLKWSRGWRAHGWKTKEKKEVLNQDLWKPLLEVVDELGNISWEHVGGHVGIAGNARVDEIALSFSEQQPVQLYGGSRSAYPIDLETVVEDGGLRQRKERSKAKAYSYVSKVGDEIQVHQSWEECKRRVEGRKARYKKAVSPEDQEKIIQEFSV